MPEPLKQRQETMAAILALRNQELGVSDWMLVDQGRIDAFADTTEDYNSVHVDPAAAEAWGLGGTIAHGLLTLSLLMKLAENINPVPDVLISGFNYGFDRVRFVHPVRSGQRVRGRFVLADFARKSPGCWVTTIDVVIEIEGEAKPALSCQWLSIAYVPEASEPIGPSTDQGER